MINAEFYLIQCEKGLLLQGLQVDLKQAAQVLQANQTHFSAYLAEIKREVFQTFNSTSHCSTSFVSAVGEGQKHLEQSPPHPRAPPPRAKALAGRRCVKRNIPIRLIYCGAAVPAQHIAASFCARSSDITHSTHIYTSFQQIPRRILSSPASGTS